MTPGGHLGGQVADPGFVPDDHLEHLDGLAIETTITAVELCTIGMWERVNGGYRVLDWEAVEIRPGSAGDLHVLAGQVRQAAAPGQGHHRDQAGLRHEIRVIKRCVRLQRIMRQLHLRGVLSARGTEA